MMNKLQRLLILMFIFCAADAYPQNITVEEYINRYKDIAMREMNLYGIPASITLAQGIHESANGNSDLAVKANNHFGIKCQDKWEGETIIKDDDTKDECFRKYKSAEDSYRDHSVFIRSRTRYSFLFDLKPDDYQGWAKGLKYAGYASNPKYPELIISTVEKYKLYQYDLSKEQNNLFFSGNKGRNLNEVESNNKEGKKRNIKRLFSRERNNHDNESFTYGSRTYVYRNNIKAVLAVKGDLYESLATELDMFPRQILKYNDMKAEDTINEGDIIYLQPKKNKGSADYHIYKSGESLREIAQLYGIKLKALYRKNNMTSGSVPTPGHKLLLRKKAKRSKD